MLIETSSNTSEEHFREYGEGLREESTMAVFENAITKPNTSYMLIKALFTNKIKCNIKSGRKRVQSFFKGPSEGSSRFRGEAKVVWDGGRWSCGEVGAFWSYSRRKKEVV